jgi:hypothetical protein
MGFINKLMFWKKKDELDFDDYTNPDVTQSGLPPKDDFNAKLPGLDEKSPFQEHENLNTDLGQTPISPRMQSGNPNEIDFELISSKLDTIKALLNSLDQRTANLEKVAGIEKQQKERLW